LAVAAWTAVMVVLVVAAASEAALISDATATLTHGEQSMANSGPDGDGGSAAIAMQ
jgi:uncharacterized membrane protein YdfJ with MMPL/SSD domain